MNVIETLEREEIARLGKTIPDFAPGDTVIVNVNVVEGERKVWRHYGDSGRWLDNYFCPTCGNTVYTTGEISPEIGISVGCFTDADFPAPKRMYWASRRHHWLKLPEEAEIMETQPEGLPYS